jgi:hypothetical protein
MSTDSVSSRSGTTVRRLFFGVTAVLLLLAVAVTWELAQPRVDTERTKLVATQQRATRMDAVFSAPDTRIRLVDRGETGRLSAIYSATKRTALFSYGGLDLLPAGKTYQLWRVASGEATSLQVLAAGQTSGSLLVGALSAKDLVTISIENTGGAKKPTAIYGRLPMS